MGLTIHYKLKSNAKTTDEARKLVSEISKHPSFGRMEAEFERKNSGETDNMRRTARAIAALVGGVTDGCKNKTKE